jgi:uncharacterized membrane protein
MSVAVAASPWPPARAGAPAWQFGHEVWVDGPQGGHAVLQWLMRRNCSITPAQLGGFYGALCAVSLVIATAFAWHGAPVVLAFAGLELLAVGVALLVFARHAGDRELITLDGASVRVEQHVGAQVHRTEFPAGHLRVEPAAGQGSLVVLSARGCSLQVGRHLRPEWRGAFARELRRALRAWPVPGSSPSVVPLAPALRPAPEPKPSR